MSWSKINHLKRFNNPKTKTTRVKMSHRTEISPNNNRLIQSFNNNNLNSYKCRTNNDNNYNNKVKDNTKTSHKTPNQARELVRILSQGKFQRNNAWWTSFRTSVSDIHLLHENLLLSLRNKFWKAVKNYWSKPRWSEFKMYHKSK